ncbi:HlyD family secretion protein [Helicobacter muridarum]|uniref:HlyD family secretion protein n=1 Tax=Helicobacter muridarum TaxID=216 RepID=A0A099TWW6_9HELI|nr:biotin/lipoyl-binding protein [Helicobacter muridarum]TLD98578.1 HlyD family secretion protein [Helicobacter muridarum]STQ85536.1 HlyD family secretion protein [Helicobacter muridarum]
MIQNNKKIYNTIFIVIISAFIIAWLGITFYRAYAPKPQVLQGQINAREYSVSSKLAGRVDEIFVHKGDNVQKGDVIFTIKSPELEAKMTQAKAGYEAAKAINQETHNGLRSESIESSKGIWQAAKAQTELAKKTYERIEQLYSEEVVSLQRRDEAYAAYQSAKNNESAAYQQYKLALSGTRDEAKEATRQKEIAALGQVEEVQAYANDIEALSPASGEVSNILIRSGELAPSGFPVVTIVDLEDSWLRLSVSENYLSRFQKDSEFVGFIPSLQKEVKFKVSHISVMGDFATWKASAKDQGYDMKSFEIEAKPLQKVQGLRIGMSVLVTL